MSGKTPIVLLSGWASGPAVWANQEKYFSPRQFIEVNYHKGVVSAPAAQEPSLYASKALDSINKATDQPVVLIGWSLGALVALELAALNPRKISGLVLVGGTSRFTQAEGYPCGLATVLVERLKKRLLKNPAQALKEFNALMFCPEEREQGTEERFRQRVIAQGLDWSKEELLAGLEFLVNRDLRVVLDNIEMPSLVIHGEKDEICPASAGRYIKNKLKNCQIELIPDCGHVPFFSQTENFHRRVRGWLDGFH